ncbi:hypothetical protein Dsin_001766 [Dipteronia sinensis]|uniref:RNase H type-1 domain-containing protein n=1 Tax=Dipteronia sinensis TaxID=43782 RepID=A0AAE0EKL9_9ROSI|nr:hypothetical protein Dsin_001766 [Dipteronia sinensis]
MEFRSALSLVWRAVSDANRLEIGCMLNCVDDLLILHRFNLCGRPARALVFSFEVELLATSMAINLAWQNGWHRIWLESDSSYVVHLFASSSKQVPWRIRQAWQCCIYQISKMEFQVSHIFKEGNQVVDALSKHALGLAVDSWWTNTPYFYSLLVGNDCMGRKSFHFS